MAALRFGRTRDDDTESRGGLGAGCFFLVFLAFGVGFTALLGASVLKDMHTWTWQKTPCVVTASSLADGDDGEDRRFEVTYEYEFAGTRYTSDRYSATSMSMPDDVDAMRLSQKYVSGFRTHCYVNRADPAQAVLVRRLPVFALWLALPFLFIAIGVWGVVNALRRPKSRERQAMSSGGSSESPTWLLYGFFSVFALAGLSFLLGWFGPATMRVVQARGWPEAPCQIVSSRVQSHDGSDGTTYSVDVVYRYEVGGREYKAGRYHFLGGSSSGYEGKKKIVDGLKPGHKTVCYANPADPTDAVLERGFTPGYLFGLIPLVFVVIGVGGLVFAVRHTRKQKVSAEQLDWVPESAEAAGPVVLRSTRSPIGRLLLVILFAAFWNGIVSVFVVECVKSWRAGAPEYFLTFFLIPFVLIGLAFIVAIGYSFLALFNARPKLTVSSRSVSLGGALDLAWELAGRTGAIRRLRVYLEGREEATYTRGTATYTDRETFITMDVVDATDARDIIAGRARVTIPPDTMHSFEARHNKIVWELCIRGDIARWPDIKESYRITVLSEAREQ